MPARVVGRRQVRPLDCRRGRKGPPDDEKGPAARPRALLV